jgi:hypothetical protein
MTGRRKLHAEERILAANLKGRGHSEYLHVDGRIILK